MNSMPKPLRRSSEDSAPARRSVSRSNGASLLIVALSTSHCTLTADTFSPNPVDTTGSETGRLEGADGPASPPSSAPEDPSITPETPSGSEEGPSPVALDPAPVDAGLGPDASSQLGGVDTPRDAGTERADAGTVPSEPTEPEPTEPEPTEPVPVDTCPSSELGSSCYEFFAERLSWEAAEARCVAWGGHLASVESSDEDDFIAGWPALLGVPEGDGSGIWLGGTDAGRDGDFRWPDGRPLSFVGWASNQPDNGAGVDCIEKRNDGTGRWYDLRCSDAEPYVCERPL